MVQLLVPRPYLEAAVGTFFIVHSIRIAIRLWEWKGGRMPCRMTRAIRGVLNTHFTDWGAL